MSSYVVISWSSVAFRWEQFHRQCLTHWGRNKMDTIFQTPFSNEFPWMIIYDFFIKISLKFVPRGPINNMPALVQIMAWHWPGDKPLSEPRKVSLLTHIYVTRPQWIPFIPWVTLIKLLLYFPVAIACNSMESFLTTPLGLMLMLMPGVTKWWRRGGVCG